MIRLVIVLLTVLLVGCSVGSGGGSKSGSDSRIGGSDEQREPCRVWYPVGYCRNP